MKFTFRRTSAPPETLVADGGKWIELTAPARWEPAVGDTIIGTFLGFAQKSGAFGPYRAVILISDNVRHTITGSMLVTMIEAGGVKTGDRLRIVYLGMSLSAMGHSCKQFRAYLSRQSHKHAEGAA